jgi:hypothetical protein
VVVVGRVGRLGDRRDLGIVQGGDALAAGVGGVNAGREVLLVARVHRRDEVRLRGHLGTGTLALRAGAHIGAADLDGLLPGRIRLAGVGKRRGQREREKNTHCAEGGAELAANRPSHGPDSRPVLERPERLGAKRCCLV